MLNQGDIIANRYELRNKLGEGGMGQVWMALDKWTGNEIALKTILYEDNLLESHMTPKEWEKFVSQQKAKFWNESKSLLKLSGHSNIIAFLDFNTYTKIEDDFQTIFYLVMEYVKGTDALTKLLRNQIDNDECLEISYKVAVGLDYAHKLGVIHRDIKPNNIMIGDDNKIKLGDFGLARFDISDHIHSFNQPGTLPYMAPEQFGDSPQSSKKSDIFQLGATVYHLFTKKIPSHNGKIPADSRFSKADPNTLNNEITTEVNEIIVRMLKTDPDERPDLDEIIEVFSCAINSNKQNGNAHDAVEKIRTALKDGVEQRIELIKNESNYLVPMKGHYKKKWYATLLLRPCDENGELVDYFSTIFFAEYIGDKMTAIAHWDQSHSLFYNKLNIGKCCSGLAVRWKPEHVNWRRLYGTDYYETSVEDGKLNYIIFYNVKEAINSEKDNLVKAHYALADKFPGVNPGIHNFVGWDLRDADDFNKKVKMSENIQTEIIIPLYRVDKSFDNTKSDEILGVLNFEWEENFGTLGTHASFETVNKIADELHKIAKNNLLAVTKFVGQVLYQITKTS